MQETESVQQTNTADTPETNRDRNVTNDATCRGGDDNENDDALSETVDPVKIVKVGAEAIFSLFIPVTLCMGCVIIVARTVPYWRSSKVNFIYTPFNTPQASTGTIVWQSLANALILIGFIVVLTILVVILFYFKCYKLFQAYLVFVTGMLAYYLASVFWVNLISTLPFFVDYASVLLFLWNAGTMAIVSIFWKSPLRVQQTCLVFHCVLMSLLFLKYLPKWTTYVLLVALAIWDLFAVLSPKGPLRLLVEMAQKRDKNLFAAMIYSTAAVWLTATVDGESVAPESNGVVVSTEGGAGSGGTQEAEHTAAVGAIAQQQQQQPPSNTVSSNDWRASVSDGDTENCEIAPTAAAATASLSNQQRATTEAAATTMAGGERGTAQQRNLRQIQRDLTRRQTEDRGIKMGLGDFVFYSLLIGRVSLDSDAITVLVCYFAVLAGMCLTLLLLAIKGKALPALPISIAFGIIFYIVTSLSISPFLNLMTINRIVL